MLKVVLFSNDIIQNMEQLHEFELGYQGGLVNLDRARPQVQGPNSYPTGSRVDTFIGNYACGGPPPSTHNSIAQEARRKFIERQAKATQDPSTIV